MILNGFHDNIAEGFLAFRECGSLSFKNHLNLSEIDPSGDVWGLMMHTAPHSLRDPQPL